MAHRSATLVNTEDKGKSFVYFVYLFPKLTFLRLSFTVCSILKSITSLDGNTRISTKTPFSWVNPVPDPLISLLTTFFDAL